jgi:ribosomal-protein-alanine N-acetyltransferase
MFGIVVAVFRVRDLMTGSRYWTNRPPDRMISRRRVLFQVMRSYFLRTERLGFAAWTGDDMTLAERLWDDPEVTRYIVSGGRMDPAGARERLEIEMECHRAHGIQYWPVFFLETSEFIGCCGLHPHGANPKVFEMGVHLTKEHWHSGNATEACSAVIEYAFHVLQADWLFAGHNPQNLASKRLLERLGFHYLKDEYYPPTGLIHPSYRLDRF